MNGNYSPNGHSNGFTDKTNNNVSVIDFYTSRVSPYCRAVKMLATHLNIPLNEIYVKPFQDTSSDEYKKIHPGHKVPAISDNGFILWESRAIMQYLCNKYAPDSPLYPKDPQLRATVDRLLNFDLKTLSHAVVNAHFEYTFSSEYSSTRGDRLVELTDALTYLEIFLINKDYVAGNGLTIADISLLANVTLLEIAVEFDLSSYSNIWGWLNRLRRELPYYDNLTKTANHEHRNLIREIRDTYEEWSSRHFCVFCPCDQHNGVSDGMSHNCVSDGMTHNGMSDGMIHNGMSDGMSHNCVSDGMTHNGMSDGMTHNGMSDGMIHNGMSDGMTHNGMSDGMIHNGMSDGMTQNGVPNGMTLNGY